jgi:hypothetical protein
MGGEQDLTPDEPVPEESEIFIVSEAKVIEDVPFFNENHVITFFSDENYDNEIGSIHYLDDLDAEPKNSFTPYYTNTSLPTTLLQDIYFTHTYNSTLLSLSNFELDSHKIDEFNHDSSSSLTLITTSDTPTIESTPNGEDITTTKYKIENTSGSWPVIAFTQTLTGA